jgi:hypothetical protein
VGLDVPRQESRAATKESGDTRSHQNLSAGSRGVAKTEIRSDFARRC